MTSGTSHLIAGAGLAGLSLTCALLDAGVRDPITLVDRRSEFTNDRTWCLWQVPDLRFVDLARHRWESWVVRTLEGEAVGRSSRHPYLQLEARDVYGAALARIERADNVQLRLGERILGLGEDAEGGWMDTVAGRLTADRLYDALALGSPAVRPILDGADVLLWQGFLGQVVEVDRPVFDPARCVLMDFRVPQGEEMRFIYILPFSPTRALVEHTSIGPGSLAHPARREALGAYLRDCLGVAEWTVEREERGRIPMTDARLPTVRGQHTLAVGLAGGGARPSSGYAFARTVGHTEAVARAVVSGAAPPTQLQPTRLRTLDAIFLQVLARDPARSPEYFRALVHGAPGDALARFMTDRSTPTDDARIMAALPPAPFAAAALQLGVHARALRRAGPVAQS